MDARRAAPFKPRRWHPVFVLRASQDGPAVVLTAGDTVLRKRPPRHTTPRTRFAAAPHPARPPRAPESGNSPSPEPPVCAAQPVRPLLLASASPPLLPPAVR